ncbi:MAG: hypothetical protein JNL73_18055 [Anaerolineales bacterium]|nr:hypothetical protein [Anaerolineales bacterium]
MSPSSLSRPDPLPWLLEPSAPGVRYLALRDLVGCAPDDPELSAARAAAYSAGPIATILTNMEPEGYWVDPGAGYYPKYRGTVWSMLALAQLGAHIAHDPRIGRACQYLLEHALTATGQFTANGAPSGTADCQQGELCWALVMLGCQDPRLESAFDWMARSVTGDGVAPLGARDAVLRYYAGKCGPTFACGSNNKLPCAWGGVKVMLALSTVASRRRTRVLRAAIEQGVEFLLGVDPAVADYPAGYSARPSGNWWKFGFPVFYVTDLLQNLEALIALGYGADPRLSRALQLVRRKQDDSGRWILEYDYAGKTWFDVGPKKKPNKWVTLRALRVLRAQSAAEPASRRRAVGGAA